MVSSTRYIVIINFKVVNLKNSKYYAIKKIKIENKDGIQTTTLREISILKNLSNPNIIKYHINFKT
jgi:serine/threonine protein kinase